MNKKVLVAVPERLLTQVDLLADYRSQTRSELIREALRSHLERLQTGAPELSPSLSVISRSRKEDSGFTAAIK